jgi:hypothetical protein
VAAGRENVKRWPGLTPAGRARLRAAALCNQPWRFATGPRTPEGKARCAANAKKKGPVSVRELRAELAGFHDLARDMAAARARLAGGGSSVTDH